MKENKMPMATKSTTTTKVHESKHFPFQIIEITTTTEEKEEKEFRIGSCGQILSEKVFKEHAKAEKYISTRPWELITSLCCLTIKNAIEYEKSQSNN